MATEVIRVVDPDSGSGYHYDSLSDWEADLGDTTTGDLPTDDMIATAKCRCTGGTADTTAVTIDGWTTDSTRYIKVWTDPTESYRHAGTYPTGNKYRIEAAVGSWGAVISSEESYVRVIGIAVYLRYADEGQTAAVSINAYSGESYISANICKMEDGYQSGIGIRTAGGTAYIYNNIIYGFDNFDSGSLSSGGIAGTKYSDGTAYVYNNTLVDCDSGLISQDENGGTIYAKNNLCYSCGVPAVGEFAAGTDYNATDAAAMGYTVVGGGNIHDELSQTFTFAGTSDYHLAATDAGAKGYGVNLYNDANLPFQDDIDGEDRGGSGATWDIGADELILVITQEGFRFRNDDGDEDGATWKAAENVDIYVQ